MRGVVDAQRRTAFGDGRVVHRRRGGWHGEHRAGQQFEAGRRERALVGAVVSPRAPVVRTSELERVDLNAGAAVPSRAPPSRIDLVGEALVAGDFEVSRSLRTPVVTEFRTRIGCWFSLNLKPWAGSSNRGAEISTPGIGPATEGLRGFSLFLAWQAASVTSIAAGRKTWSFEGLRVMVDPQRCAPELTGDTHAEQVRAHYRFVEPCSLVPQG